MPSPQGITDDGRTLASGGLAAGCGSYLGAAPAAEAGAANPTRVRYKVVALAVALGMVTYLDRVCISKLAPNIMADLSLSRIQMGYVFSAFALSYALFALPAARWD